MALQSVTASLLDLTSLPVVSVRPHEEGGAVRGMFIEFANGAVLSVQWRDCSYSSVGRGYADEEPTFEVAAWDRDEEWILPHLGKHWESFDEGDQVYAYQTVAQVMVLARQTADFGVIN